MSVARAAPGGLTVGAAALACAAGALAAQGAVINGRVTTKPTPDSVFVANWVAAQGANTWHLDVGPNGRYRLWRVERGGDTLVASMGDWSMQPLPVSRPGSELVDHVCLAPFGAPGCAAASCSMISDTRTDCVGSSSTGNAPR